MKWNFAPLQAHDIFVRPSDYKIDFDIENVREWLEIACALFVYLYASVGNFCVHFFSVITMYTRTQQSRGFYELERYGRKQQKVERWFVCEWEREEGGQQEENGQIEINLLCCFV